MLSVEEFASGTLSDAEPLALMFLRTAHNHSILVGRKGQKRNAVFIGGDHNFHYFEYDTNDIWSGLIVKRVLIEVDESTFFDASYTGGPLGHLVRQGTSLCVCAVRDRDFGRVHVVPLMEDLESMPDHHRAGFLRWQIVIGTGAQKRVLRTIDVRPG